MAHWAVQIMKLVYVMINVIIILTIVLSLVILVFGANDSSGDTVDAALTRAGDGIGGLYGVPDGLMTLLFLVNILPYFVILRNPVEKIPTGAYFHLLFIFPLLISLAYLQFAHLLDPCYRGIYQIEDEINGIVMCQMYGQELNIHPRIHTFWHVINVLPVIVLYRIIFLRNKALFQSPEI